MTRALTRRTVLRAGGAVALNGAAGMLGACATRESLDADVLVIGADLSGLNAARLVRRRGLSVCVLEASGRIGGRMYTLDELETAPEAGGAQIGSNYARVLGTLDELGLDTLTSRPSRYGEALSYDGEVIRASEWAGHAANPLEGAERSRRPWQQLMVRAAPANPLRNFDDWMRSEFVEHDVSYLDFMRASGASDAAIRMAAVAPNVNDLATASMLDLWRSFGAPVGSSARCRSRCCASSRRWRSARCTVCARRPKAILNCATSSGGARRTRSSAVPTCTGRRA